MWAAAQKRVRTSCSRSMKGTTNACVRAADLLQDQQGRVGASMNGCGPTRLLGARPLRFGVSSDQVAWALVSPAKAGVQGNCEIAYPWIPAFAGMTNQYDREPV